jgi:hypothetical protein
LNLHRTEPGSSVYGDTGEGHQRIFRFGGVAVELESIGFVVLSGIPDTRYTLTLQFSDETDDQFFSVLRPKSNVIIDFLIRQLNRTDLFGDFGVSVPPFRTAHFSGDFLTPWGIQEKHYLIRSVTIETPH